MKKKTLSILFVLVLVASLSLVTAVPVAANSVGSSTMEFEGILAYDSETGIYSGVIPMVVDKGYDIYGKEGASAWFGDDPGTGPVWTEVGIVDHDAWPSWNPDTPDWYQYSLNLYEDNGTQKWAVRNHPGATAEHPWYESGYEKEPMGVPMSGEMDWTAMYASETDTGAYLPDTGTGEIPGGAATHGGGAGAWDMDWSWGSEVVPLQFPGFDVSVTSASDEYHVTLTPAANTGTELEVDVPDIVAISVDPTSIDFGTLIPGQTSAEFAITVENIGTHEVDVDADVSGSVLFTNNLELRNAPDGDPWGINAPWSLIVENLAMGDSEALETRLPVPSNYVPAGVKTATLTFTASASP